MLTQWDCKNLSDTTNTIDRYLHHKNNLKVVVTLPFLVGHREEVHSTLWGFKNTQYIDWINKAEQQLALLVDVFGKAN